MQFITASGRGWDCEKGAVNNGKRSNIDLDAYCYIRDSCDHVKFYRRTKTVRPELIVIIVVVLLLSAVLNYCMCVVASKADEEAEIIKSKYEKEKRNGEEKGNDFPADGRAD